MDNKPTDKSQDDLNFTPEQQAFLNKRIGQARVSAREKAQTDAAADATKAKGDAEQAKLVADAEWQKLATRHEAEAKRLAPFEAEATAYRELVKTMLADRIKTLGDKSKVAVKALPEGMSDLDRLTWLNANEGLFGAVATTGPVGSPGVRVKPAVKSDEITAPRKRRVTL